MFFKDANGGAYNNGIFDYGKQWGGNNGFS